MDIQFENSLNFARMIDAHDELREFRNKFILPKKNGKEQIYFLGNSLGLQPKSTQQHIQKILDQWGEYGVEGFFMGDDPWLTYHDQLVNILSEIVGCLPHEVVVMNQLTVNLHLMMASFYQPEGKKNKILCEAKAFPSDQYMMETYLRHVGLNPDEIIIEISPRAGEYTIRTEDILQTIEQNRNELALVFFGAVNYYTGQFFDVKAITATAQRFGAKAGFDLAHAAGNVQMLLHDWNVDFACWCSYKYLNSGPGAVAGAYIHERFHNDTSLPRLAGWWGYKKETRFEMHKGFEPVLTAEGWQVSTPPLILLACHKASLEIFEEAGMNKILKKAQQLNDYLLFVLNQINFEFEKRAIEIITPQTEDEKGCQLSLLMLKDGKAVFEELQRQGIFADWREPNVIRVAPVALYNTYEEVWRFGEVFRKLIF
jgi:kynureninase